MVGTTWRHLARTAPVALLALASFGCIDWQRPVVTPVESVRRYISLVQTRDGQSTAVLSTSVAPSPGSGVTLSTVLPAQVVRGGTLQATLTSPTPFSRAVFSVPGNPDHWELTLPSPVTSAEVLLVISVDMPKQVFTLQMAGGNSSAVGQYLSNDLAVIFVGTGEVQTNVTWDTKADVDLHLIDPSGTEIYYSHRSSPTGGTLDLDSNAACQSDGPRAENIYWGDGLVVPHGEYILRVDYYANCTVAKTNYTVTINLRGLPPKIFTGTFEGTGSSGGAGSGKTIAIFNY